jgi:signal transduction histidine kinase/AmiR/NasT family two-component response regulator
MRMSSNVSIRLIYVDLELRVVGAHPGANGVPHSPIAAGSAPTFTPAVNDCQRPRDIASFPHRLQHRPPFSSAIDRDSWRGNGYKVCNEFPNRCRSRRITASRTSEHVNKSQHPVDPPFHMSSYRLAVVRIGMIAVAAANALFALTRFVQQWSSGIATPWWCNALMLVLGLALYRWYWRAAEQRVVLAIQGTAIVATLSLLVPLAYGNASSVWWLSLIGLAMVLMANRWVALIWCLVVASLMAFAPTLIGQLSAVAQTPEPASETLLSRLAFALVLFGIALSFRAAVRRQARELREVAAALEASNRTKDRFLQHMGHELRTPLHGVIALTDQALNHTLDVEQRARIVGAHASATVLLRSLNDVLDFAAGRADSDALVSEEFSAREILFETAASWSAQATERGLELNIGVAEGWLEPHLGDAARFRQIVDRLIGNAVRFTREGKVEVKLAPWLSNPEGVTLSVADTGEGMTEAVQANLFQPFAQGDASSTREQGGLGLGLARVRDLAERMGGRIELHSAPQQGSRFVVYLAITPAASAKAIEPTPSTPSLLATTSNLESIGKLRVLVCEDDDICRELLVAGLTALGHDSEAVADGLAGWTRQEMDQFDAILTDIEMPKLDGIDLARRVRAYELHRGIAPIAIVAVTARAGSDEAKHIMDNGFDALLTKPFRLTDVRRVLDVLMPKVRHRRQWTMHE